MDETKIWVDLVLKIESQVIQCMNLFSVESRSIDFFGGSIDTLFTQVFPLFSVDRSTIYVDRST
jgi:hypothetical protein